MEYPHRKFITYLVTKKMSSIDIMEECLRLSLLTPDDTYLSEIKDSLGKFPVSWRPDYDRQNEYFNRWLRGKGVLHFWMQNKSVQAATRFLYRRSVRKDFETLSLSMPSVKDVRDVLLTKYEKHMVPEEEVLSYFCRYYWDLSILKENDLIDFLSRHNNRSANMAAIEGDTALAYSLNGIPQRVDPVSFYDNLISFANQQINIARREAAHEPLRGSMIMGIAAISRQAIDAIQAKEEMESAGRVEVLDSIREQASAFVMRTVQVDEMPTIEDIMKDEEIANVTEKAPTLTVVREG